MRADIPSVAVLGVPIAALTTADARAEIEAQHAAVDPAWVAFANAHALNLTTVDTGFRDILRRADLVLNDGSGVAVAARLQGRRFPDNLNGTDLLPMVLDIAAERGWRVYLLGARPGIAARARERLVARFPGLDIVEVRDGYFDAADERAIVDAIRRANVDLLIVGMGNPLQERWLDEYAAATGARLSIAVGAFLDFAAGAVPRAPRWMSRAGLEWMYRLKLEPRRMWRRYVLGNPLFLWRVVIDQTRRRWGRAERG